MTGELLLVGNLKFDLYRGVDPARLSPISTGAASPVKHLDPFLRGVGLSEISFFRSTYLSKCVPRPQDDPFLSLFSSVHIPTSACYNVDMRSLAKVSPDPLSFAP